MVKINSYQFIEVSFKKKNIEKNLRSYVDHEYREKGETRIFFRHKDKSACAGKSISCLSARDQSEDKLLRFLDRLFFSQFPSVDEKLLRLYYTRRVHLFRVHQRCWENVNNVLRRKKTQFRFDHLLIQFLSMRWRSFESREFICTEVWL